MTTTRRTFLKWTALLGLLPLGGSLLTAQPLAFASEGIGSTHMDEAFDPEGWL